MRDRSGAGTEPAARCRLLATWHLSSGCRSETTPIPSERELITGHPS
ncbi:hypothetical protein NJ7G_1001 [Natrinema sp. J7-2]|nr:hypothetical protein NJ7G_1001 [Natrinema sp. J7-2]